MTVHVPVCLCAHMWMYGGAIELFQDKNLLLLILIPRPDWVLACHRLWTLLTKSFIVSKTVPVKPKGVIKKMRKRLRPLPFLFPVPTPPAWLPALKSPSRADTGQCGTFRSPAWQCPGTTQGWEGRGGKCSSQNCPQEGNSKRRQGGLEWVGRCGVFLLRGSESNKRNRRIAC